MKRSIKDRILKALQEDGLVDENKLEKAVKKAEKNGTHITDVLVEDGVVSDQDLLIVLSKETDIPPIDVKRLTLDAGVMSVIPEKIAQRYCIVPLSRVGDEITVIVSDPTDVMAIDDIKTVTGCGVDMVLASPSDLKEALGNYYTSSEEDLSSIVEEGEEGSDLEVLTKAEGLDILEMTKESTAAPIVKMVDLIISEASAKRASDIHVEPQEKSLRIRYRVDGELQEAFDLPKKNQNAIIARLKIMSNLDITETRVPQDGRFRIKLKDKEVDFRVSVLPITYGNKIVLRALDRSNLSVGLETLGFLPGPLNDFKEALSKPFGIILVTGPTGSGKSTTLYSVLSEMNTPERNIVTIEDPVEYQVAGITQIAARPEIGLDFTQGLRALLRQSPDVIMVGEIRDFETADIAIKASLTGQMVLSTLHTNDSVGAIIRLVNMGIEPFLVSSSLVMACAQRLLRKICTYCKTEEKIPDKTLKEIKEKYPEAKDVDRFYTGAGCDKCNGTGYLGRLGTLETLLVDDKIREMINKRKPEREIREYLDSKNVGTLHDNAMKKFIKGWTSLEEVLRVTG
ncbi:MAG: Flp pilus assembly complex ATPase component TadA [Candidatus Omnitrophica bacterium]|nr:Flp pilus assembly complex ATPase component TadA [Candidatus Omnitrophota bacterium]